VIVPILATTVREIGEVVSRVIVPRAQTKQQFQILRRTLTGLCNRPIVYLPFNRQVPIDAESATTIRAYLERCGKSGGVWLCEPEQILSLKLLGLDRIICDSQQTVGGQLVDLQRWLHQNSRDILDESDEVLHTRQQVIYTVGEQGDLDGAPLRWEIVQRLLALFAKHLLEHTSEESLSNFLIEETKKTGAFPHVRIQSYDSRQELHRFIIKSLEDNEWALPQHLRRMAIEFVTTETPSQSTQNAIIACSEDEIRVRQTILCLRGLIGADILLNGLMEKRWRVHYGLDLKRSPLAVPFRAKDCPSARSEFAIPT